MAVLIIVVLLQIMVAPHYKVDESRMLAGMDLPS
jgi:hypothetical protein